MRSSLPLNSMLPMDGRSITDTTSVSPSRSSRTSRKNPVPNNARSAAAVRCAVHGVSDLDRKVVEHRTGGDSLETLQPDVPDDESIRRRGSPHCGAQHERGEGDAQASQIHHHLLIVVRAQPHETSLSQQPREVIVECESHQANEQGDSQPLSHETGCFRHRPVLGRILPRNRAGVRPSSRGMGSRLRIPRLTLTIPRNSRKRERAHFVRTRLHTRRCRSARSGSRAKPRAAPSSRSCEA